MNNRLLKALSLSTPPLSEVSFLGGLTPVVTTKASSLLAASAPKPPVYSIRPQTTTSARSSTPQSFHLSVCAFHESRPRNS